MGIASSRSPYYIGEPKMPSILSMALRMVVVAAALSPTMGIVPESIGPDRLGSPGVTSEPLTASFDSACCAKELADGAKGCCPTYDAVASWSTHSFTGDYLFKGTHWISLSSAGIVDNTYPRDIMQGFPELAYWQACNSLSEPARIAAAVNLAPDASRAISPDKTLTVFFKAGAVKEAIAVYEQKGRYGKFIGAYPTMDNGQACRGFSGTDGYAGEYPKDQAEYKAFVKNLGLSDIVNAKGEDSYFESSLKLQGVQHKSGVSLPGQKWFSNGVEIPSPIILTYAKSHNFVKGEAAPEPDTKLPAFLVQGTDGKSATPVTARTTAEKWLPFFSAMAPTTTANRFKVYTQSVMWIVELKMHDGTGAYPADVLSCGAGCKQSYFEFVDDATMNAEMNSGSLYSLLLNWPKIIEPVTMRSLAVLDFCEPRSTLALASMSVTVSPAESDVKSENVQAKDGAVVQCQDVTGAGEKQLNFKVYSKSGLIVYQSSATTYTRSAKNKICLRIEDTTPACDDAIDHQTRLPASQQGAVTGKVFVTTTSVEPEPAEVKYQYVREKKEVLSWEYAETVF